jgi:hypothetical protein
MQVIHSVLPIPAPLGAYMQRVLGGFLIPLTRFCKTHGVLRIWQILSAQVLETGQLEGFSMTDKEKETKEGIAYRTKRTIDRTKEEFYHPIVG